MKLVKATSFMSFKCPCCGIGWYDLDFELEDNEEIFKCTCGSKLRVSTYVHVKYEAEKIGG